MIDKIDNKNAPDYTGNGTGEPTNEGNPNAELTGDPTRNEIVPDSEKSPSPYVPPKDVIEKSNYGVKYKPTGLKYNPKPPQSFNQKQPPKQEPPIIGVEPPKVETGKTQAKDNKNLLLIAGGVILIYFFSKRKK